MNTNNNNKYARLKIYISTTDTYNNKSLYEYITELAFKKDMYGTTVIRGIMGYGASSRKIESFKFLEFSSKLPIIIEIIDEYDKIKNFFEDTIKPILESIEKGCIVTIEPLEILLYKHGNKKNNQNQKNI